MTDTFRSNYADLLNDVCDMQESPNFAYRKQTLINVEHAIVTLEQKLLQATQENAKLIKTLEFWSTLNNTGNKNEQNSTE